MDNDFQSLQDKIDAARGQKSGAKPGADDNAREGVQAGIELAGAVFVSVFIGYWLDVWLGSKPLFLIVMFFLGVATGFYNVYRVTQNMGTAVGSLKKNRKGDNSGLSGQEKDDKTPSDDKKD